MLNLTNKTAYHYFDDFGMLVVKGDKLSWRDSIGRTVLAWIAYEKPKELFNAIEHCYRNPKLYRHPKEWELASRDHWSYFLIQGYLEYGISRIYTDNLRMRGMNSWMKALTGNKFHEWWYYVINIAGARLGNGFLRFCRWWMNFGGRVDEATNEWWIRKHFKPITVDSYHEGDFKIVYDENMYNGLWFQLHRTRWQKLWAWIIFQTMPAYSLHNKAWQLYVMPESRKKEKLKRILLKRVGKSNIMLRLLLEPEVIYNSDYLKSSYKLVTQEEVDNYPHMTGYRPGVYLDETCRRDIRELTDKEAEANCYEKDLIIYLFNKQKNEM